MLHTPTNIDNINDITVEEGYEIVTKTVNPPSTGRVIWRVIKSTADWAVLLTLFAHFVLVSFFGTINMVSGQSMDPTLADGQRLISLYNTSNLERGDIVVAEPGVMGESRIVKRVIALEGDTIAFKDGDVFLNGDLLNEPYILGDYTVMEESEGVIPEGHVWIMGDNRDNSIDSRVIGFVSVDEIESKVIMRYLPFTIFNVIPKEVSHF